MVSLMIEHVSKLKENQLEVYSHTIVFQYYLSLPPHESRKVGLEMGNPK